MNASENPESGVELIPASVEQKPVLANLLELYSHDFCDFIDLEIGHDGRFGYCDLDLYWTAPQRHPFLIYVNSKLAGFALVNEIRGSQSNFTSWDMVEFFVLRRYRRRGIGTRVAHEVFSRFPGQWQVRVRESNQPACKFWKQAAVAFTGQAVRSARVVSGGAEWSVFSFPSGPAVASGPAR